MKVEYQDTPPQIFISQLNAFIRDLPPLAGLTVQLPWEKVVNTEQIELEEQQQSMIIIAAVSAILKHLIMSISNLSALVRDVPRGYTNLSEVPVHRGPNHCLNCLCAPCIIEQPPDFLRGSCDPHPANAEKRHMLYKKFWQCLNTLGVWRDEEYIRKKELRTARDDRRDIMPDCVIYVRI